MTVKSINQKLNLVIELDGYGDNSIFVHSTPITFEVFKAHRSIFTQTFATFLKDGGIEMAHQTAHLILEEVATRNNMWGGEQGVDKTLIPEMYRLTNVIAAKDGKWSFIPLENALKSGILDSADANFVLGALTFFIVSSAITYGKELLGIHLRIEQIWGPRHTLLNCTEFVAGLPKLMPVETISPKVPPSPIPR